MEWNNPHRTLGLHEKQGGKIIRLWRPEAKEIHIVLLGNTAAARKIDPAGIFEVDAPAHTTNRDYLVYHANGLLGHDPYAFSPTIGEWDEYLFNKGVHYELYNILGARVVRHEGIEGVKFAVWAPAASNVSLVGDFNFWDGRANPMRTIGSTGIWELFVPNLKKGDRYKFEIHTAGGQLKIKTDPCGYFYEKRPLNASIVWDIDQYQWKDASWLQTRKERPPMGLPMNIYEVHLGSWKQDNGEFINYRELAHQLANYCKKMHFSHVELLPIAEHPLDESWGYQVTGFFAPTSRFGTPDDFQYFVDHLHENGIGVILDWVPAHFPNDDFSLAQFDGSYLYEHEDPRKGYHPHWNTHIFNYGRYEVSNFLIANALFWFKKMHVDALRVDAVASMLYLDYGREHGEWIPNIYGGNENLEAIEFLKHLNSIVHKECPGVLMIAEESTAFPQVTGPVDNGGLGFDLKWNLGWMNDTLRYFRVDPLFRRYHLNNITFGLLYAFSEKFVLVLSHDEVVHGKGSLLSKMPGDDWQKFAQVRLLYGYMMTLPGKKLFFMGGEMGQWNEWNCREQLPWFLLEYDRHRGIQACVRDLNQFYHESPALWKKDFDPQGFEWIDFSDVDHCVVSYLRKGEGQYLVCVHNFTPEYFPNYIIRLANVAKVHEVFNTDREEYGGSGKINPGTALVYNGEKRPIGFSIRLAPMATMIFNVQFAQ